MQGRGYIGPKLNLSLRF